MQTSQTFVAMTRADVAITSSKVSNKENAVQSSGGVYITTTGYSESFLYIADCIFEKQVNIYAMAFLLKF